MLSQEPAGCPLGTTLVVRDLFYNTPARLKFMKRDAAEGAAVFALVQKLALSHPGVSFQFIRDGKRELMTPGDGKLSSALYAVLGRDMALGFTPVRGEGEDVTVTGFVSLPACCRGSRTYQHFFVNGRPVKSKLLMAALERAYENQKMVGKFPGCVLQLQVKASQVDVNVHPAKTEVKFLHERQVFDGVYYGVLSALQGETRHPTVTFAPPQPSPQAGSGGEQRPPLQPAQGKPVLRDAAGALLRPLERAYTPRPPCRGNLSPVFPQNPPGNPPIFAEMWINRWKMLKNPGRRRCPGLIHPPYTLRPPAGPRPQLKLKVPRPLWAGPKALRFRPLPGRGGPWRLAGEILQTYLIVEQGMRSTSSTSTPPTSGCSLTG
ncbi:MAG: DNA mismatch repair endonuclease MutL [Evtepia gabavorous]